MPGGMLTAATSIPTTPPMPRKFSKILVVTDDGARCDGRSDDTVSIQSAINVAAGKAQVYIPNTGKSCIIETLRIPSNSQIVIDGQLLLRDGANVPMLTIQPGSSDVILSGSGTLNGNRTHETAMSGGILSPAPASHYIWIMGLSITNFVNWPINLTAVDHAYINDLSLTNSGNSAEFAMGANNCWANNLRINGINDEGFSFYGGVHNCGISNSTVTNNIQGIGIFSDVGQPAPNYDISVLDNKVFGNRDRGIYMWGRKGNGKNHYNIMVKGNDIYGNNKVTGGSEIEVSYVTRATILDNKVQIGGNRSHTAMGISIGSTSSFVNIIANNISDESPHDSLKSLGIQVLGARNVTIQNNSISDNRGTSTMVHGLTGFVGPDAKLGDNRVGDTIGEPNNLRYVPHTDVAK